MRPNSLPARDQASVLHPYADLLALQENGPLVIRSGEGVRVRDEHGRDYIESVAGLWCASLGFSNERLARAAYDQMRRLPFYHAFGPKSHEPMIELAEMLLARAPAPLSGGRVFFANSGSEANDTAIKMAWYYNNARGLPRKKKIIGRQRGYHGITLAAASLTGLPYAHASFDVPLPGFLHTVAPSFYHHGAEGETEEAFAARCADELDRLILAEGPDTVAAFFAEPVQGAGGVIVPPRGYFEAIQQVLRRHDVLMVADEVICGFGRTGSYWGSQTFGIRPDILTCAKALSAAYLPISAVVVSAPVFEAIARQSHANGNFGMGYTYSGHPVPAAVAIEALRIYDEINLVDHVRTAGPHLQVELRRRFAAHPFVGEVRGVGMIAAVQFVADKATKRPFQAADRIGPRLMAHCESNGVIGRALPGDALAFSPPLVITEEEIDEMLDRVEHAVDALTAELAP